MNAEKKQKELKEANSMLATLAADAPCGILLERAGEDYPIIYANDFYYQLFGYTKEEAKRVGFTSNNFVIYPPDLTMMRALIKQNIAESNYIYDIESRYLNKSGEIRWLFSQCRYNPETNLITTVVYDTTCRKEIEERLRISEEGYRIAAAQNGKLVLRYDMKDKKLYKPKEDAMPFISEQFDEDVPYSVVQRGDIAPESTEAYLKFFEAMLQGKPTGSTVARMKGGYGKFEWYQGDFTMIFSENAEPLQAIVSFTNITEQREKELAYEKWRQTIEKLPHESKMLFEYNLTQDFCGHQEGGLMQISSHRMPERFNDRTRYTAEKIVFPEDRQKYLEFVNREYLLSRYYQGDHEVNVEFRLIRSDGFQQWVSLSVQMVPYPCSSEIKAYLLYQDIDKRKRKEIWLQLRLETDALTGVLNRQTFIEKVNALIKESGTSSQHAFVMIDLDEFKNVNDRFGHSTGDDVLIETTKNLKLLLRSGDLIGRLGGDEFIICLTNIPHESVVERRAQLICKILHTQVNAEKIVTGSLGISLYPRDGLTFEKLYKKADIALYKAKKSGRNCFVLYHSNLPENDRPIAVTPIDHTGFPKFMDVPRNIHMQEIIDQNDLLM